jgi:hypothetical protein
MAYYKLYFSGSINHFSNLKTPGWSLLLPACPTGENGTIPAAAGGIRSG